MVTIPIDLKINVQRCMYKYVPFIGFCIQCSTARLSSLSIVDIEVSMSEVRLPTILTNPNELHPQTQRPGRDMATKLQQ
jgi:hypothetical protein